MCKKFLKILSAILGCVILISFSACALKEHEDGTVTSLDDHTLGNGDPDYFTFFFCDYLFDNNQFEKDNVNLSFFYSIDGSKVFLGKSNCWYSDIMQHGDIVEDNLYITMENPAIEKSADYMFSADGSKLFDGNSRLQVPSKACWKEGKAFSFINISNCPILFRMKITKLIFSESKTNPFTPIPIRKI